MPKYDTSKLRIRTTGPVDLSDILGEETKSTYSVNVEHIGSDQVVLSILMDHRDEADIFGEPLQSALKKSSFIVIPIIKIRRVGARCILFIKY